MWRSESLQRSRTKDPNNRSSLESRRTVPQRIFMFVAALAAILALTPVVYPQGGGHVLLGDVKVEDVKEAGAASPMAFHIILYTITGHVLDRQVVSNNGRYRFSNVRNGEYDVGIEVDAVEVGRVRVMVQSMYRTDFRQDIALELKPRLARAAKGSVVSAADLYERGSSTKGLFERAERELSTKKYDEALRLLKRVVEIDPQDFQAWTELGTVYLLLQEKPEDAEKAYRKATEVRPTFTLALLNLGRILVMQKKFEAATEPLTRAVELQPASAEANFLLGESYLLLKKGSKAVGYLSEAAKLGRYDAHLRLATLYNAAGMKDKAVTEYEEFLKKQPKYPDRKKLEQYIGTHRKRQ